tara:strand:+ start:2161 stop:2448 length:288 start_codon:yes stop_codon:yes gene_type:complete
MKILEFIFTNISLRTYTITASIIFTLLYYFIFIFLIKFYSESENENNHNRKKSVHIIIKFFVGLFALLAGIVTQGVIAEIYIFRDWECSLRGACI